MKNAGQSLVFLLVLLPVLVSLVGLLSRVGALMLRHDQIENHCDKKILDALAAEGRGLQSLGALNAKARAVILARRWIDELILAASPAMVVEPELLAARAALRQTQATIAGLQKSLIKNTVFTREEILHERAPAPFAGKIIETYGPLGAEPALDTEEGFRGEVGAPLVPARDFAEREKTWGHITILSERFLWPWQVHPSNGQSKKFSNLTVTCQAQLNLDRLEAPWSVHLNPPPKAKPLWSAR